MMSSEEDVTVDSYGLLKKTKRSRQRVDAGEPRNSYSSIPNFSSRPNLLNSGIYGAFFAAQNHQPFASSGAYFNQGFGPTKMLNELLSRRVKTITDNNDAMMTIDVAGNDMSAISGSAYDCLNNQSPVSRVANTLNGSGGSPPVGEMAQHMLRNILQERRKKELYDLKQELRVVNNNAVELNSSDCGNDFTVLNSNNNNNSNLLNNNNNINNNSKDAKILNLNNDDNVCSDVISDNRIAENLKENLINGDLEDMDIADADDHRSDMQISQDLNTVSPSSNRNLDNNNLDNVVNHDNDISGSERSISSPESVSNKDEHDDPCKDSGINFQKTIEQAEIKRARVENIVSSMRSSPLPMPVNGCKKRKHYHPQQHDNSVAERYTNSNDVTDTLSEDEDENLSSSEIRQKVVEKNALKNQVRTMQVQLAELQQKYVQLCTQMEETVETPEQEETTSEMDQDDDNISLPSPEKNVTPDAIRPASKETNLFGNDSISSVPQPSISPAISKMLTSKFLPSNANVPHINPHSFPLHPNFNGALSFLQHQMFQEQQQAQNHLQSHHPPHHHHHPSHPHPALSNAAAVYLGVSHKLLMEQEARMAKEAALVAEHQHQLNNQTAQQTQHSLNHQSNSQAINHHTQSIPNVKVEQSSPLRNQNASEQSPKAQQIIQQQTSHQNTSSSQHPNKNNNEYSDRYQRLKNNTNSCENDLDIKGLAEALKTEIQSVLSATLSATFSTTLSNSIDEIISKFQQKRIPSKNNSETVLNVEQLNKDFLLATHLLDSKSPRTKVIDRGGNSAPSSEKTNSNTPTKNTNISHSNSASITTNSTAHSRTESFPVSNPENNINAMNLPSSRPPISSNLFPPPKLNSNNLNSAAAAAALYSSMNSLGSSHLNPFCLPDIRGDGVLPEQNEALSLVVAPKKKRHKVTDTRITPRTVSRILAQDGMTCPPPSLIDSPSKYNNILPSTNGSSESPPPRSFHIPSSAPMLPVSLPTSVAIPNPSLHESQIFSSYSPFYSQHQAPHHLSSSSPPNIADHLRDSPPLPHHSSIFHPALLAAAQQQQQQQQHHQRGNSPDYLNIRSNSGLGGDSLDRGSDCNSIDGGPFDGLTATSTTLSPMHLRKAKLMFFWVRYPSSAVLKMYFPDIKFNKNNTAQLVKWFSNFREFYYIQMEKYARQAIQEGINNADDLRVSIDCDIYRVLNLHYNRNNSIEVPSNFRYVVEQTLKEFFKAIQAGKDQEQSWKKSIYKVISRLDDPVPEYFKSSTFLEQLE